MQMKYLEHIEKGIAHLQGREVSEQTLGLLQSGLGSREACLRGIASSCAAQALLAWFQSKNLEGMKSWAFLAAKATRMVAQGEPGAWWPAYIHLYPLLSEQSDIIDWFSKNHVSYYLKDEIDDRDNPREDAFHGFQALLALRGKWSELEARSLEAIHDEKTAGSKFLVDYRFYLALARRDVEGMENALEELAGPLAPKRNFEHAFGLTQNLIATHAVIYSKIAFRWGHTLRIRSSWVPSNWLPVNPLKEYDQGWNFMADFDIWEPFAPPWTEWSPKKG